MARRRTVRAVIQVRPRDLVAVRVADRFYCALLLDSRRRLFGGYWSFAFYRTSTELLAVDDVLDGAGAGFHAFIDFIWAKRENRIARLARKVDAAAFEGPGYLRSRNALTKAVTPTRWFIYDMEFRLRKETPALTDVEKRYPHFTRIDDYTMCKRIDARWSPEMDLR